MKEPLNDSCFDVRTLQRNLDSGRVTPAQAKAFLDALEDCGGEAAWTSTSMAVPSNATYVEPVPEDE
jgi:hypothetical protein